MAILIKTAKDFEKCSQYEYTHLKSVGNLGVKLSLSAGDNYIIGDDFIAELMFWAGSYNNNQLSIWEQDKENKEKYFAAREDLLKKKGHIITTKPLKEFMEELDIQKEGD